MLNRQRNVAALAPAVGRTNAPAAVHDRNALVRPRDNLVSVTFAMAATEFAEASQVVKIISGEIEPP